MSHRTESAEPLAAVMVSGGQVWLRRNAGSEEREREFDAGDGDSGTYTVYHADEVTFRDPSVTEDYAREHFDELWAEHDGESLAEQVAAARQLAEDNAAALLELGDIIGGE